MSKENYIKNRISAILDEISIKEGNIEYAQSKIDELKSELTDYSEFDFVAEDTKLMTAINKKI